MSSALPPICTSLARYISGTQWQWGKEECHTYDFKRHRGFTMIFRLSFAPPSHTNYWCLVKLTSSIRPGHRCRSVMVAGGVQTVYLFLCYDILFFHLCFVSEPLFSLCVCINVTGLQVATRQILVESLWDTYLLYRCPYFSFRDSAMGREIYWFKTGFTESQRADSARADSPGILTFFSWCSMPIVLDNHSPQRIVISAFNCKSEGRVVE